MSDDKKDIAVNTWPYYSDNEISAVVDVLSSGKVNYWTGNQCREFEKEFADLCHSKYAVAVANGTVALELALRALDIGPGDEVIVPSRTFIATASAVIMCGAQPVFADIDANSLNITVDTIRDVLSSQTKAIITVHVSGWPCDMDPILDLAEKHNIKVIEDCAQAHGAVYKGRPIGSLGDVAAFSFCQDKIITTGGEGGMLVTNDKDVWEKAWSFKDHGKSYDAVYRYQHPPGFRWLHQSIGTNWRLTEIQAAIGRQQLKKLPAWHAQRIKNASVLAREFKKNPALRVIEPPANIEHAYYKYDVFIVTDKLKKDWNRDRIMTALNEHGIPCFTGSCSEIYLETAFDGYGKQPKERLPVARVLGETGLTFLVHPTLGYGEMKHVCSVVKKVFAEAMNEEAMPVMRDSAHGELEQGAIQITP